MTKLQLNPRRPLTGSEMISLSLYHYSEVSIPLIAYFLKKPIESVENTIKAKSMYVHTLTPSFIENIQGNYFEDFYTTRKSDCLLYKPDGTFVNYKYAYGRNNWRICRPRNSMIHFTVHGKQHGANAFRIAYESVYGLNPRVKRYVPIDGDLENLKLGNILPYKSLSKEEFGQIYSHIHSVGVSEEDAHRIYDPILGHKRVRQILSPKIFPKNDVLSAEILDHVKRGKKLKDLLSIYKDEDPDLIRYEYRKCM